MAKKTDDTAVTEAPATKKRYKVALKHSPTFIVTAAERMDAWDRYRDRCGLIRSEHDPVVEEVHGLPDHAPDLLSEVEFAALHEALAAQE